MKRARHVMSETEKFLSKVLRAGLIGAIEKGWFAGIKRRPDGGKGLAGVFKKGEFYFNPVEDELKKALKLRSKQ